MNPIYDPAYIRAYYDDYGMKEWDRWDRNPVQSVKFQIHLHYLRKFVRPNNRVLEIGAGRFTRELSVTTRRIVVGDISPVQLELNRTHAAKYGYESAVEEYIECDVVDLSSQFSNGEFDSVVCYGGVLSYTLDRRDEAVEELSRVTKSGGYILISVVNLFGSTHQFLPQILVLDFALNQRVVRTGTISAAESELSLHRHHMFRAKELRELLERHGLEIAKDKAQWDQLIQVEIEAAAEPGCLDTGTNLIAVCRKP